MGASELTHPLAWIAVDWGSSNLRAWAMDAQNHVMASASSPRGMLSLTAAEYEAELLGIVDAWLPDNGQTPVMVCGMAGARQGWQEAAYLATPTRLDQLSRGAVMPALADARLQVYLLPGLSQSGSNTHLYDVMRGEETQLAGLLADSYRFNGLVCLPGTHAKWARLTDGAVTEFATYLTGELYQLLAHQSVLKHSVGQDDLHQDSCRQAFTQAVKATYQAPERFSQRLFGVRAQDLLDNTLPSGDARGAVFAAHLSGLAIGLELAGACHELTTGESVTLIGNEALNHRYALALEALDIGTQRVDGDTAVLAGLTLAYQGTR
ncbi:2-dehydro-3-deoxygalactonokinase [Vreelandella janggokensis]|uniref:2-dehydro-3-deoxygalactonokinase n=1 Tax=Vreelandella janggokensis TaxID=370767 RepID=UPI00285AD7A2|nr:2-dehydro-3-deoxygalactonokinase [Halomonas janggokensis]MDR5887289.1 2-dehydro-3-deoxygalactonokinase [Halomonas janggokensis]